MYQKRKILSHLALSAMLIAAFSGLGIAHAATLVTPTVVPFSDMQLVVNQVASMTLNLPLSNSPGNWSLSSSNEAVVSASGMTLRPISIGVAKITATQVATGNFTAASITFNVTVVGLPPTLGPVTNINYVYKPGQSNLLVFNYPTTNSTGLWSAVISDPQIATISGNLLTVLKPGKATITIVQAASGNFGPSIPVTVTLNASDPNPTPSPTVTPSKSPTPTPTPTVSKSPSPSPTPTVSKSPSPSPTPSKSVTPSPTPTPSATTTPTKSPVPSSSPTKSVPVVGVVSNKVISFGDSSITLVNPASNSPGTWSYVSSDPKIVSINGNVVEAKAVGSATITATQSASGNFSAVTKTFQILVNPGSPTLSWGIQTISASLKSRVISPPASPSHGLWSYQVSNPLLAKVTGGSIQGIKAGSTTITAVQAADGNYREVQVSTLLVVNPTVSVTVSGQVINVVVIGGVGTVTINGQPAKVGKNTVTSGAKVVKVFVDGKIYLSKGVQIL